MTTERDTTGREAWQQALARFEGLSLLYRADDKWGPLFRATLSAEAIRTARFPSEGDTQEDLRARIANANERQEAELTRHMDAIYDPLVKAALALIRTPAPDLAAAAIKHDVCNADDFDLPNYEEEEGELFGILCADVARLLAQP